MAEFTHLPLPPNAWAIRLLDLQPSSDSSSDICCSIRDVSLDTPSHYKALSYVWGDPSVTLPILVNDRQYHVTVNCHAALVRLRDTGERSLWIDAICINQKDNKEKSIQVPLMRHIYSKSEEVIIWLGRSEAERRPEDEASEDLAFSLMVELLRQPDDIEDLEMFFKKELREENSQLALERIFSHPWFQRLWVHQELIVSSKAKALFQYRSGPFRMIEYMAISLNAVITNVPPERLPFFARDYGPYREGLLRGMYQVALRAMQHELYSTKEESILNLSLLRLLDQNRLYQCTDPRDRVFALIGLVEASSLSRFQIDYSQSVAETYTTATWNIIQEDQSLEVLAFAGLGDEKALHPTWLPSWVADWNVADDERPDFLKHTFYRASLGTTPQVSLCTEPLSLEVRGFQLDTVETLVLPPDFAGDSRLEWVSGTYGLLDWKKSHDAYPTECDPHEAWIRTITTDLEWQPDEHSRLSPVNLRQYIAVSHMGNYPAEEWERAFPKSSEIGSLEAQREIWEEEAQEVLSRFTEGAARYWSNREFCVSKLGYMALAPLATRVDDILCIIHGCKVPLVIRKDGDYYLLVGECFVWGLMDGEAMRGRGDEKLDVFRLR